MWPAFSPTEIELRDRIRSFLAEALPPRGPIPEDGWIHGFDPEAPRHRGLSELLVDMRLPGITVRPLVDMTGEHHFNELFFEQVRVPKRWLIGEQNRGWFQIASQLDYERAGMERLLSYAPLFRDLAAHLRATGRTRDP